MFLGFWFCYFVAESRWWFDWLCVISPATSFWPSYA